MKIPILLYSFNRPHYLNRINSYYQKQNYDQYLIIADGSEKRWPGSVSFKGKYLHLPGLSFRERIIAGLEQSQSDLAVLCADDDFLVPAGLEVCTEFLRNNPDYSCAQGRYVRFVINNGTINYSEQRPWLKSIIEDEPLNRIKKGFIPKYSPYIYAVHKKVNVERILSFENFGDDEYLLVFEELLTFSSLSSGKAKRLDELYCFREMGNVKTYKIEKYTMVAKSLLKFEKAALNIISDPNQRNSFTQIVEQVTNVQMKVYFSSIYNKEHPSLITPPTIIELLSQIRSKLNFKRLIKYCVNRIKKFPEKDTFPLTSYQDQNLKEFQIIDKVIIDCNIT